MVATRTFHKNFPDVAWGNIKVMKGVKVINAMKGVKVMNGVKFIKAVIAPTRS